MLERSARWNAFLGLFRGSIVKGGVMTDGAKAEQGAQSLVIPAKAAPASIHAPDSKPLLKSFEIYRIVYFSRSAFVAGQSCWTDAIRDILAVSRRNNRAAGITGALTFNDRHFAQILEGSRAAVADLFRKIANDTRHTEVAVVEEGWVEEREFAAWAMAYFDARDEEEMLVSSPRLGEILASRSEHGTAIVDMMKYHLREGEPE